MMARRQKEPFQICAGVGLALLCLALLTTGCSNRGQTQPNNQSAPGSADMQQTQAPLPDDVVSMEARAAAGGILDRLLTGKLGEGESGLATRVAALKGFESWSIDSQQKVDEDTSELQGNLTGPNGQTHFSITMVKQGDGKWMVGVFSGPNAIE